MLEEKILSGKEAKLPLVARSEDCRRALHGVLSAHCLFLCEVWPGNPSAQGLRQGCASYFCKAQTLAIVHGHVLLSVQARLFHIYNSRHPHRSAVLHGVHTG